MFKLDNDDLKKISDWKASRDPMRYAGASGGRWTYSFTPTSLGTIVTVTDNLVTENNVLDLTDYVIF